MTRDHDLTRRERELLDAAQEDDISMNWALEHLGIWPESDSPRATAEQISTAFDSLARLHERGLIVVGPLVPDDPPRWGRRRKTGAVHVESEPLEAARQRVLDVAARHKDPTAWYFAAWIASAS
jgi:hypothetical protein